MNTQKTILEENGGKYWEKQTEQGLLKRVYFSRDVIMTGIGLDVEYYHSGNISRATLDGQKISNSEAGRILAYLNEKFYYDLIKARFHYPASRRGYDNLVGTWMETILDEMETALEK